MPPRQLVALLVGVCVLSAGIGTGITLLLAEEGPQGPRGEQGSAGPEGPPGPAVDVEVETRDLQDRIADLEASVDDLESRISDLEFDVPIGLGTDVSQIEGDLSDLEFQVDQICRALDLFCP
jgi:hypothetical protein